MKTPIVILHGWGKSGSDYKDIQKIFEKNGYTVYTPDFPGFGNEKLTKPVMTMDDYVDFLLEYIKKQKLKKAILVCHSFGGRVAAKFAVMYPEFVEKIVLSGSPLVKQKLSLKKNVVQQIVKKGRQSMAFAPTFFKDYLRWGIYRFIGEWDYYKAKDLREIFKNVIHEDASLYIGKIKQPVLVLWGAEDRIIPEQVGKKIAEIIPHAKFVSLSHEGHKVPYENPKLFASEALKFIENT